MIWPENLTWRSSKTGWGTFDMIHTENFILVDPDRRVRGFYDGTDSREIQRLLEELEILTKNISPPKLTVFSDP